MCQFESWEKDLKSFKFLLELITCMDVTYLSICVGNRLEVYLSILFLHAKLIILAVDYLNSNFFSLVFHSVN